MNEDVEPEVGGRLPEWPQALRVELLPLNLGCNDGPRETEVNCATLEFGCRRLRIQRRDVREPDEAAGMVALRLMQAVIDQPAGGKVGLVEARAAGQHRNVDACPVHHPHMRGQVGKQRIEAVIGIAVFVQAKGTDVGALLH